MADRRSMDVYKEDCYDRLSEERDRQALERELSSLSSYLRDPPPKPKKERPRQQRRCEASTGHVGPDGKRPTCKCGARVRNDWGETPLHSACQTGQTSVADFLLEVDSGAVNYVDDMGNTPLHVCCRNGHWEVTSHLVAVKGCVVDAPNHLGNTPLHLACLNDHLKIVQLLLNEKSDVNFLNVSRNTPLHVAAQSGYTDIVKLLLADGRCNLSLTNKWNFTPVQLAERQNHLEVVEVIVTSRQHLTGTTDTSSQPTALFDETGDDDLVCKDGVSERGKPESPRDRLRTFQRPPHPWPLAQPSAEELARVGFVYLGQETVTECYSCKVKVYYWEEDANPLQTHHSKSPNCPFLMSDFSQELKGLSKAKFSSYEDRFESFGKWPLMDVVKPEQLAGVGFFYTGKDSATKCFSCGVKYKGWRKGEVPLLVHKLLNPRCVHLNSILSKGSEEAVGARPEASRGAASGLSPSLPSTNTSSSSDGEAVVISKPDYSERGVRLRSFKRWRHDELIHRKMLAEAGFYLLGPPDVVKCFACAVTLRDWVREGVDPVEEHRKARPSCPFIQGHFPSPVTTHGGPSGSLQAQGGSGGGGGDPSLDLPEPKYDRAALRLLHQQSIAVDTHRFTVETLGKEEDGGAAKKPFPVDTATGSTGVLPAATHKLKGRKVHLPPSWREQTHLLTDDATAMALKRSPSASASSSSHAANAAGPDEHVQVCEWMILRCIKFPDIQIFFHLTSLPTESAEAWWPTERKLPPLEREPTAPRPSLPVDNSCHTPATLGTSTCPQAINVAPVPTPSPSLSLSPTPTPCPY